MSSIATLLMFSDQQHGQAKAAIDFYLSLFDDASLDSIVLYGPGEKGPQGSVQRAEFTLLGRPFIAIDSPTHHNFSFTPSMSIFVGCDSEEEIDFLYAALVEGGEALMPLENYGFSRRFGWVNDRFGVSWQLNLA
ncbi:MAG: VOC family protein [Rheinheimera sp.]|nr:VOC family protein [Rheinheimera sp.]